MTAQVIVRVNHHCISNKKKQKLLCRCFLEGIINDCTSNCRCIRSVLLVKVTIICSDKIECSWHMTDLVGITFCSEKEHWYLLYACMYMYVL